ncbi:hypothetical protein RintRC_6748 [Richelia intracellularis]|nr:hypothetical protein RintRC_6748 [Richelia intracellularis]
MQRNSKLSLYALIQTKSEPEKRGTETLSHLPPIIFLYHL